MKIPLALHALVLSFGAIGFAAPAEVGPTVEITRSHAYCWFPTVHKFQSGEILVGMNMSPDERNPEGDFSAYCVSRDGGRTWGRRYTMGLEANQDGAWLEVPDADGSIWQLGCQPESAQEGQNATFRDSLTKYSRGGRVVNIDRDAILKMARPVYLARAALFDYSFAGDSFVADTRFTTAYNMKPWGSIIRGPGGELLTAAYYIGAEEAARHPHPRHHFRVVLLRSADGGQTWTEISTIATAPATGARPAWMGLEGATEGTIALLPDKRLYAVYRTGGGGTMGNSWSADGGKTWTAPASLGFKGVAPRLHRLADGRLAMVTGRPGPVVLRFSDDGLGEKWSAPVVVFEGKSTRYADFTEIEPGKLLVVYDNIPYDWYQIPFSDRDARNTILGTFVAVRPK